MRTCCLIVAAAALVNAGIATAEPPKPQAPQSVPANSVPAKLVLASAEPIATPEPVEQAQAQAQPVAPVKKRAARVTSCRCAGQTNPEQ